MRRTFGQLVAILIAVTWPAVLAARPTLPELRLFLRLLAPHVVVDAVASGDAARPDDIVAVHLRDAGEPPLGSAIPGISTGAVMLFEGDTEQGLMDIPDDIELTVRDGRVTLRASKQSISLVAYRLAEAVGIPFDLQVAADELVDVAVTDVPLARAVHAISPKLRLYMRTDLQSGKSTPLRLVWHAP